MRLAYILLVGYLLLLGVVAVLLMDIVPRASDVTISIRDQRIEDIQCNPGERIVVFPPTATPSS